MESEDIRYEIKDMRYNWRYADFLEILVGFRQQSDKLLFAGMAGCKCVTMACDYRNTIGGCSVSLPGANCCLGYL